MDRSWISEDDPWLVEAMHVTAEINRREQQLIKAVAKAMDEYLRAARDSVESNNLVAAAVVPDLHSIWPPDSLWVQLIELHVLPIVQEVFDAAFKAAVEGVAAAVDIWRSAYIAQVKDRLSPSRWPKDAFTYVSGLVSTAIETGKSVQELTKQLLQVLQVGGTVDGKPVWEFDARRIARTEVVGALNGGTYNGALAWQKETGQTRFKQWLATSDDRTRETHRIANHQVQPFADAFSVGTASLQFPGDPTGPPQEVIQCRCVILVLSEQEAQNSLTAASTPEKPMTEPPPPHWRGPIAALDTKSGDGRMIGMPQGEPRVRENAYLMYAPANWGGHDGSVNVGRIDRTWIDGNLLMGEGRFDLGDTWALEVIRKMREKFAGGISVDLDDFTAEIMCTKDGTPVECQYNIEDADSEEVLRMSDWRLAGATLVDIPAFPEAFIELLEENMPSEDVLVAAAVGAAGLPLADREREWDGSAAAQRVADWARGDGEDIDPEKYRQAFFYYTPEEDPTNVTAYKLGFADYVDGQLIAVPRGIFAVAAALEGSRGGVDIPEADVEPIRRKVAAYYTAMAKKFDDPSIVPPWESGMADDDSLTAAGLIPAMAPKKWFQAPDLDRPTPLTVSNPDSNGYRRVFGHVAAKDVCHTGIEASQRRCVTVPESPSDYAMFNRLPYETDGGVVQVGRITTGHGSLVDACSCCPGSDDHACLKYTFNQTLAHHDKMDTLAYVHVGTDEHGVWFAGVAASDLSQDDLAVLARQKVSGDWRSNDLVEILALSSEEPGFPIPREKVRHGMGYALVAAGVVPPDNERKPSTDNVDLTEIVKVVTDTVRTAFAHEATRARLTADMREIRAQAAALDMEEV